MDYNTFLYKTRKGNKIEYHTCGPESGYPVLYMHGAVPMPFSKKLIQTAWECNLYLIMVLRPGYGASSRVKYQSVYEYISLLKELILNLKLERFDVLGLSAGSPYCYALAAACPELVAGVNICSGIPLVNIKKIYRMNTWQERFLFSLSKYLPANFIGKYGAWSMEAMERKKGWHATEDGVSMDVIFQKYVRPNWYGLGRSTHLQYKNWGFDAVSIPKKVSIYHSKTDEMIPFNIAVKSAELLSNSEVYEYDGEEHSSERLLRDALLNIAKERLITCKCLSPRTNGIIYFLPQLF